MTNNKCLIISETIQAMTIKFAVKIVRLKICMTFARLYTSASQTWLLFNLQYLEQYLSYYIQPWYDGRLMDAIHAHVRFDSLDLDARSQWVGRGKTKNQRCMLSATKQAISSKLATTVCHFVRDLDFANVYMAWPSRYNHSPTWTLSVVCEGEELVLWRRSVA